MDDEKLRSFALLAFPDKKRQVREYFSLIEWMRYYEERMHNPDSTYVCSGYNNTVDQLESFVRKHPDIIEWVERFRKQLAEQESTRQDSSSPPG